LRFQQTESGRVIDPELVRSGLRLAPVWSGDPLQWPAFFPDELPEDWRLAYCAQFWPALCWSGGPARLLEFLGAQNPAEGLRFYVEDPGPEWRQPLLEALGPALGGLLLPTNGLQAVQGLPEDQGFREEDAPDLPHAAGALSHAGPGGRVLRIRPLPGLGLREWRALLEAAVRSLPDARQPLFLEATPGEIEQGETLLRLAGRI
jgi:hypothetical protein